MAPSTTLMPIGSRRPSAIFVRVTSAGLVGGLDAGELPHLAGGGHAARVAVVVAPGQHEQVVAHPLQAGHLRLEAGRPQVDEVVGGVDAVERQPVAGRVDVALALLACRARSRARRRRRCSAPSSGRSLKALSPGLRQLSRSSWPPPASKKLTRSAWQPAVSWIAPSLSVAPCSPSWSITSVVVDEQLGAVVAA